MLDAYTNKGNSLMELSKQRKVMLVFLRHFGCNFCKETLSLLEKNKEQLLNSPSKVVIVHQSSREHANKVLDIYSLSQFEHVSDPSCIVYKAFGIEQHSYLELLKPSVIWGTLKGILMGHLPGKINGDPLQKPGIMVVKDASIVESFNYSNIASKPPLLRMAS
ncbi:MAG: redoxin domain-containing protein [Flavobacteriales bacterium]|nr:redoxin domain-containing protein [Flavobacteriales bacterium]